MKVRLIDFMDPNRPLAKAARDLDWTSIVALFPDASHDGFDAARVWVLASIIILGEITGLSESEVLQRWPENPYWQAFSGFAQFQWTTPVTQADCLTFKRYLDSNRAARLTKIARSIVEAKPLSSMDFTQPAPSSATSVDSALALRQVHFSQPPPPQPYKAPPKPDFHVSIKQMYARAAAPAPPPEPLKEAPPEATKDAAKTGDDATKSAAKDAKDGKETSNKDAASAASQASQGSGAASTPDTQKASAGASSPHAPSNAESGSSESASDGSAATAPQFAVTYGPLRKMSTLPPAAQAPARPATVVPPSPPAPQPVQHPEGAPKFDTTTPTVLRAAPGEPVKMEISVTGTAPLTYQWETFDDLMGTATPIEGCTDTSLTVALEPSDSMLAFQCRVTNSVYPQGMVSRTFFIKKAPPKPQPQAPAQPARSVPSRPAFKGPAPK